MSKLVWKPMRGMNLILGGGDIGKTTILEAIALLLSPAAGATALDTDYYARRVEEGFSIHAVLSLPSESGITKQSKHFWPWRWDGEQAVIPTENADGASQVEAVYCLQVQGTPDLELQYEILQPNGETEHLSAGLRRELGLVRLAGDDRSDRDLRLVQGSALDRLLSDRTLRARLASELTKTNPTDVLLDAPKQVLKELDAAFQRKNLPTELELAITGGPGFSVAALIGLTANRDGTRLPLASWGAGTRRFAALAIASQNQGEAPITLVDEIERGLEPYRQRVLVESLQEAKSQVFVTTHSACAISAASNAALWYIDHDNNIGLLSSEEINRHKRNDPEAFLAKLTIVAEGITEAGFATVLLEKSLGGSLQHFGIHVTDGHGHDSALGLLEALCKAGMQFGAFIDNEGRSPTRWARLTDSFGGLLFRWQNGCTEENVLRCIPNNRIQELLDEVEKTGERLRALADRLKIPDKSFSALAATAGERLKTVVRDAALGEVPADVTEDRRRFESHRKLFFKSFEGGCELATKVFALHIWPDLKAELMPFCNAVRKAVSLNEISDIEP